MELFSSILILIYVALGYWAYVKIFSEGKSYMVLNPVIFYGRRFFFGIMFGIILIPIAIIKLILQKILNKN